MKAIIIIHGMGEQEKGYSQEFQELLKEKYSNIGGSIKLDFYEINWSSILSEREKELFNAVKGDLSFLGLRKFIIHSLGDAIAYQKTEDTNSAYNRVHTLLETTYQTVKSKRYSGIYFVAHSLGAVVMSDFIYDRQNTKDEVNFNKLFTFGTTLPLWTLKYGSLAKPIAMDSPQEWINMFDNDDVLGYPIGNISSEYQELVKAGKLRDIEVNVGSILSSWNPACHSAYWTDSDVIEIIANEIK